MDLADDVAYSVHDVEDGIVADRLDLTRPDLDALWETVREWYLPDSDDGELAEPRWTRCARRRSWPRLAVRREQARLAAIKNLTSDLVGPLLRQRPGRDVRGPDGPFVRHRADLVVPRETEIEIGILKAIAAHYVMQAQDRVDLMEHQREPTPSCSRPCGHRRRTASTRRSSRTGTWPRTTTPAAAGHRRPGRVLHRRARINRHAELTRRG